MELVTYSGNWPLDTKGDFHWKILCNEVCYNMWSSPFKTGVLNFSLGERRYKLKQIFNFVPCCQNLVELSMYPKCIRLMKAWRIQGMAFPEYSTHNGQLMRTWCFYKSKMRNVDLYFISQNENINFYLRSSNDLSPTIYNMRSDKMNQTTRKMMRVAYLVSSARTWSEMNDNLSRMSSKGACSAKQKL